MTIAHRGLEVKVKNNMGQANTVSPTASEGSFFPVWSVFAHRCWKDNTTMNTYRDVSVNKCSGVTTVFWHPRCGGGESMKWLPRPESRHMGLIPTVQFSVKYGKCLLPYSVCYIWLIQQTLSSSLLSSIVAYSLRLLFQVLWLFGCKTRNILSLTNFLVLHPVIGAPDSNCPPPLVYYLRLRFSYTTE